MGSCCRKNLLRAGAEAEAVDDSGRVPLHYAAWHGHTALVKLLIDMGARVDTVDALH